MSQIKIEKLTPQQEALIGVYREKWRRIALSTDAIDPQKASKAVKAAYKFIRFGEPEIIFCDSPYAGSCAILILHESQLWNKLKSEWNEMWNDLKSQLSNKLWNELCNELCNGLNRQLNSQLHSHLKSQIEWDLNSYFYLTQLPGYGSLFDFCISVLGCAYHPNQWQILQSLLFDCGWIFPFQKTCYVCDRPRILSFDNQQRLHAEGEPAIQYANGFSVYAYHGVRLPEKYGKVHPNQWQVQWILEEENAELRRVLIQGIGYTRICQELQATELDSWREYTLVKIDENLHLQPIWFFEPIYLLKMTCPSTGFIHALRVPPDMKSAREAISWVNWGIDPEEFGVET
ncbi:MAG TPA: hypothetical protein DCY88_26590 [Cyanobacteria bacterium UBA11372]|nr:hypothetical protein [Cyanobacteria bacterium UBA11372]